MTSPAVTDRRSGPGPSPQIADEFGVTHRTVRHYEDLGLDHPRAARHDRASTTGATAPASTSSCAASGSASRSRRSARSSTSTTRPRGRRGQLEYVLGQIDERRADLEQRRRDLDDALAELDDFEEACRADLARLR